jgi:hypothetical protein
MNEPKRQEQLQPLYPPYVSASYVEEEINLVDIWIELVRYQKVFWAVFALMFMLGLTYALVVFEERFHLISAIEIGSIGSNGTIKKLESAESLKSKLSNVLVPKTTVQFLADHPELGKFATTVSSAKGSDIVLIQNKVEESAIGDFTLYQTLLAGELIKDHDQKIAFYQADLEAELASAQDDLEQFKATETLRSRLDKQLLLRQTNKSKLTHIKKSHDLLEQGGKELILTTLSDEDRAAMTRNGSIDQQLLNVRYKDVLLSNQLQQDELQLMIASIDLGIIDIKRDYQIELDKKQREVQSIQAKLDTYNRTRVISQPVTSLGPEGMTRNLLIVLVVLAAGFAGFGAMLLAMFRYKVNQRRQELT